MPPDQKNEYRTVIPNRLSQPEMQTGREHIPHLRILIPVVLLLTLLLLFLGYVNLLTQPPDAFHPGTLVEIPEGHTLSAIADQLHDASVIRSPLLFKLAVQHYGKENNILSGAYIFKTPASVIAVAKQMALGDHGMETLKVTLPEGLTTSEMAKILSKVLPSFDAAAFLADAKESEGFLFPDTYFFFSTATSGEVLAALKEDFDKKTAPLYAEAETLGRNWNDILIMASIIEEETATPEDRRIVSGILWKRLSNGMRLQVDATFAYTIGKGSLELTVDDLKSDSPYNTYRINGLPPTPIANPGLDAIEAALHPTASLYVYYLSDKSGVMHYSKTFEEHKLAKAKYLR
jgi:UPF0755 protein